MNYDKISKAAERAASSQEQLRRLEQLFAYPAADELPPNVDDQGRLVTMNIGGPSTSVIFYAFTRAELRDLIPVFWKILVARHEAARTELLAAVEQS